MCCIFTRKSNQIRTKLVDSSLWNTGKLARKKETNTKKLRKRIHNYFLFYSIRVGIFQIWRIRLIRQHQIRITLAGDSSLRLPLVEDPVTDFVSLSNSDLTFSNSTSPDAALFSNWIHILIQIRLKKKKNTVLIKQQK